VGPAVEARLTKRFAVEADALYQPISYSSVFEMARPSSGLLFAFSKTTASRWQVPILLKRRFGRFFVLAGGALDGLAGVHSETDYGGREFISGRVSSGHLSSDDTGQITKGRAPVWSSEAASNCAPEESTSRRSFASRVG
jgi:hypothetical protein